MPIEQLVSERDQPRPVFTTIWAGITASLLTLLSGGAGEHSSPSAIASVIAAIALAALIVDLGASWRSGLLRVWLFASSIGGVLIAFQYIADRPTGRAFALICAHFGISAALVGVGLVVNAFAGARSWVFRALLGWAMVALVPLAMITGFELLEPGQVKCDFAGDLQGSPSYAYHSKSEHLRVCTFASDRSHWWMMIGLVVIPVIPPRLRRFNSPLQRSRVV